MEINLTTEQKLLKKLQKEISQLKTTNEKLTNENQQLKLTNENKNNEMKIIQSNFDFHLLIERSIYSQSIDFIYIDQDNNNNNEEDDVEKNKFISMVTFSLKNSFEKFDSSIQLPILKCILSSINVFFSFIFFFFFFSN